MAIEYPVCHLLRPAGSSRIARGIPTYMDPDEPQPAGEPVVSLEPPRLDERE
jgi:hypothetical protein